jgi:hypothetical protein
MDGSSFSANNGSYLEINTENSRLNLLNSYIRVILNVHETLAKRLQTITAVRAFLHSSENEIAIRKSYDKLLPTLEQLLLDRFVFISFNKFQGYSKHNR